MDVKEAVTRAKTYLAELYSDERISNVGLEEVEMDDKENIWTITIGFSRPWDEPRNPFAAITNQPTVLKRSYKIVRVNNLNGAILSVKNRDALG